MKIRDVLAMRLRELMQDRITLDTQTKIADKSGVGQSTVQRILTASVGASIDSVEQIADAFGVRPVDLLSSTPDNSNIVELFGRLGDTDKRRVLSFIDVCLKVDSATVDTMDFDRNRRLPPQQVERMREASANPIAEAPSIDQDAHARERPATKQR